MRPDVARVMAMRLDIMMTRTGEILRFFTNIFTEIPDAGLGPVIKPDGQLWLRGYWENHIENARAKGSTEYRRVGCVDVAVC